MIGKLTTHVLDTAHGRPGAGIDVALYRIGPDDRLALVATARTDDDGRAEAPLLTGEALAVGVYEFSFQAGAYFRRLGVELAEPAFLDDVRIRFAIADPSAHYHVPLLVSPWSYTTYRGS